MSTLIEDKMRDNVVSSSGGPLLKGGREVEGLRSKVAKLQKEKDEAVREVSFLLPIISLTNYYTPSFLLSIVLYIVLE
jgi:hypothetical protein